MTHRPARIGALVLLGSLVSCAQEPPPTEIRASGHVEATDVRLAPEVGGRILLLTVKEGDRVEADSLILRLDGREISLAVQRAQAEQAQAEAQLKLLRAGARREDIAQAQANAQAARDDQSAAGAELRAAETDLQRYEALRGAPPVQRRLTQAARRCRGEAGCGAGAHAGGRQPGARRRSSDGAVPIGRPA